MESATAITPRISRRQALARRRPRRRCVAADLSDRGMRTPLRPPRASLESTRGGSGRTPEQDRPTAGIRRPRTGESRNRSQRQRMTDLTNPANESMILSSAHQSSHWADHGTCPIPSEATQVKHDPFGRNPRKGPAGPPDLHRGPRKEVVWPSP